MKALAYKAKNRTQELLSDAKTIELKNPQRISISGYWRRCGSTESRLGRSKERGLAKDYDGEGLDLGGENSIPSFSRIQTLVTDILDQEWQVLS